MNKSQIHNIKIKFTDAIDHLNIGSFITKETITDPDYIENHLVNFDNYMEYVRNNPRNSYESDVDDIHDFSGYCLALGFFLLDNDPTNKNNNISKYLNRLDKKDFIVITSELTNVLLISTNGLNELNKVLNFMKLYDVCIWSFEINIGCNFWYEQSQYG